MSKPTWWKTSGCFATSAFLFPWCGPPQSQGGMSMDNPNSTIAKQVALAACDFERQRTRRPLEGNTAKTLGSAHETLGSRNPGLGKPSEADGTRSGGGSLRFLTMDLAFFACLFAATAVLAPFEIKTSPTNGSAKFSLRRFYSAALLA